MPKSTRLMYLSVYVDRLPSTPSPLPSPLVTSPSPPGVREESISSSLFLRVSEHRHLPPYSPPSPDFIRYNKNQVVQKEKHPLPPYLPPSLPNVQRDLNKKSVNEIFVHWQATCLHIVLDHRPVTFLITSSWMKDRWEVILFHSLPTSPSKILPEFSHTDELTKVFVLTSGWLRGELGRKTVVN